MELLKIDGLVIAKQQDRPGADQRYEVAMEELHLHRRIFNSVTSGITVADATVKDFPLVYVNPAFERMTGYTLEEIRGRNCRFLQGPDRDQPEVLHIREALATQSEIATVLKNYRKDGTPFWNELLLSPIRNRDGKLTHVVGIQMDVTARVEFEAALRESEKLAAVGRLAASIAHEINNPLESVTNLIYLARISQGAAEIQGYLEQADGELRRVAQIAAQSLRFYRQSSKAIATTAAELLDSLMPLYDMKLGKAHVRVERRDRSQRPLICMESEIRQVLNNLVRNALDAMSNGGGRLVVRTRMATRWSTGQSGVTFTVADTGSGISTGAMKNLYTAFFTTKEVAATGLGLWVSAEIVKRHKGSLRVRSSTEPEKSGTVFQLFLPLRGVGEGE